jgi:hypothetical protein
MPDCDSLQGSASRFNTRLGRSLGGCRLTLLLPSFSLIFGAPPIEADKGKDGRGEGIRLSRCGGPAEVDSEGDSKRLERTLCSLSLAGTEARSEPGSKYGLDPRLLISRSGVSGLSSCMTLRFFFLCTAPRTGTERCVPLARAYRVDTGSEGSGESVVQGQNSKCN